MQKAGPRHSLTRRDTICLLAGGAAALSVSGRAAAGAPEERGDLDAIFQENGVTGTFVLYDASAERLILVNPKRAETRFVPASTFKIANSLIALETKVVADENEVIPYGGKPQPFKQWEKDMPMREAITASNVPIYQELARRIGLERYRIWLDRLNFGNRQIGNALESFWLDGPLEISAIEEAKFVARLAQQQLDISPRSQSIVREILRLEKRDGAVLFGKTGWRFSSTPQLGWWTGWIERDGKILAFSLNLDMAGAVDAPKRVAIGKSMLAKLGAY